ncbi:MAG: MBL fold metallo-hydrolase [Erysipelotrichaceae bacterium]|nr:MBL fold metallo-hydrolase [Erysipelotrichaceae bacterium]
MSDQVEIAVLSEDHASSLPYHFEHGLSLFIKIANDAILFDVGQSMVFYENAKTLDIDIAKINKVIISHGHYDHINGLVTFLDHNSKAMIYLRKQAINDYYSKQLDGSFRYIGVDSKILASKRLSFTSSQMMINEYLTVFTVCDKIVELPSLNNFLFKKVNNIYLNDDFDHEQNLMIDHDQDHILIVGCCHMGIINILNEYHRIKGYMPTHVIGGFHLYSSSLKLSIDKIALAKLAQQLLETNTKFYTCHCTGLENFQFLKHKMKSQISYLAAGSRFLI